MLRALTIVVGAIAGVTWARRGGVHHVVVSGPSMLPTLAPGDRLLLVRTPFGPRVGQLTVVPDPRASSRLLLKRVHALAGTSMDLRGDNVAASTDSRTFGRLPRRGVHGYVAWRYAPRERAGHVR